MPWLTEELCGNHRGWSIVLAVPRVARGAQGTQVLTMLLIILSPPLKVTASMEAHSSA